MGDTPQPNNRLHRAVVLPPGLPEALKAAVDEALRPVLQRLNGLEEDLGSTTRITSAIMGSMGLGLGQEEPGEDAPKIPVDTIWSCSKCGTKLGFYDREKDVLRTRYKDFGLWGHIGVGGWLRQSCRNCGELNVVEYAPAMSPDGVDNVLQVDGDILVLDGPLLEQMQALVATSPDGRVQIRLKQTVHPDAR